MAGILMALVDGSAYSESVCNHAAWVAGRTGAQVKIYHVLDPRRARSKRDLSGAIKLGARSNLLEELSALDEQHARLAQAQGRAILEDAKALVEAGGVADVVTRLRHDDIVATVTAKEEAADMIMIGKRGEAAGLDKEHLGSNFERIVRASGKPVFVANRAFRPIARVLIAYDGGVSAMKAVDYVAASLFSQVLRWSSRRSAPTMRRSASHSKRPGRRCMPAVTPSRRASSRASPARRLENMSRKAESTFW